MGASPNLLCCEHMSLEPADRTPTGRINELRDRIRTANDQYYQTDNPDLADLDERLVRMIARIVEAYGKYNSSRGPSFSSYQALKAMARPVNSRAPGGLTPTLSAAE